MVCRVGYGNIYNGLLADCVAPPFLMQGRFDEKLTQVEEKDKTLTVEFLKDYRKRHNDRKGYSEITQRHMSQQLEYVDRYVRGLYETNDNKWKTAAPGYKGPPKDRIDALCNSISKTGACLKKLVEEDAIDCPRWNWPRNIPDGRLSVAVAAILSKTYRLVL